MKVECPQPPPVHSQWRSLSCLSRRPICRAAWCRSSDQTPQRRAPTSPSCLSNWVPNLVATHRKATRGHETKPGRHTAAGALVKDAQATAGTTPVSVPLLPVSLHPRRSSDYSTGFGIGLATPAPSHLCRDDRLSMSLSARAFCRVTLSHGDTVQIKASETPASGNGAVARGHGSGLPWGPAAPAGPNPATPQGGPPTAGRLPARTQRRRLPGTGHRNADPPCTVPSAPSQ